MDLWLQILLAVIVAAVLELLLLTIWIVTEAIFVRRFKALKSVDSDFFKEKSCAGIPYIEERGIPYKGSVEGKSDVKEPLNEGWRFSIDSNKCSPGGILGAAEEINLPHCYNLVESLLRDYRGNVWYEKTFNYKPIEGKPKLRLTFMGSFLTTDVWLDGRHIGTNGEGYLPFYFDLTGISEGPHKLVVKVNNEISTQTIPISLFEGHKVGWHHYSGIHKEVFLEHMGDINVFKLACIPVENQGKWSVDASILLERSNISSAEAETITLDIVSDKDKVVATRELKVNFIKGSNVGGVKTLLEIPNPSIWSETTPILYIASVKTIWGEYTVKFGLRSVSWGEGKVFVNGKPVFLKGVCRHEDNGVKGLSTDTAIINNELKLIAKANCNFVRLAHYPHSKVTLESTDIMGMYAWDEVPFYQAGQAITHDSFGKDGGEVSLKNCKFFHTLMNFRKTALARDKKLMLLSAQSLIKMVERDINHPSIISWSVGNEIWSVNEATGKALKWLREQVRRYDTSRAVNYAAMCMPLLTVPMEASFKYMDWVCINEYFGWYYGKVSDVGKMVVKLSKKYPDKPLIISETGSDTKYGLRDFRYPPENRNSEDYQKYFYEETWKNLLLAPTFSGMVVWVMKDFPCPEYGDKNLVPYYNMKGLFDKDMNEKMAYKVIAELFSTIKSE
jgi:beta-glucuronidase